MPVGVVHGAGQHRLVGDTADAHRRDCGPTSSRGHHTGPRSRSDQFGQQFGDARVAGDRPGQVGIVVVQVYPLQFRGPAGCLLGEHIGQRPADPGQDLRPGDRPAGHLSPCVGVAGHDRIEGVHQGAVQVEQDGGPARDGGHGRQPRG